MPTSVQAFESIILLMNLSCAMLQLSVKRACSFFLVARKDFGLGGGATLRPRSTEMAAAVDNGSFSLNLLGTLNLDRSLNTLVEA